MDKANLAQQALKNLDRHGTPAQSQVNSSNQRPPLVKGAAKPMLCGVNEIALDLASFLVQQDFRLVRLHAQARPGTEYREQPAMATPRL